MKLINGFLCGALTVLALSGCGGGGSDGGDESASQRILNKGIVTSTNDGVYQVADIESTIVVKRVIGNESLTVNESTRIDTVYVDFEGDQISLAFSNYINLENDPATESEFFLDSTVYELNNIGEFVQVDADEDSYELIAANDDGIVLERVSTESGFITTETVAIDYQKVADDYLGFIVLLDQLASTLPLNRPIAVKRLDKGLFKYTNTSSFDQALDVAVGGVEAGATGGTVVAAFSKSNRPLFAGQLNYEGLVDLDAINGTGEILEVLIPAGETVYVTFDVTEYEPSDSLTGEQVVDFFENDTFNLTFTTINVNRL